MKLTPNIQQAINFVAEKHLGQKRKGTPYPYVVHPFSVAVILSGYTDDENIIVAGLLHDILEDVPEYKYHHMAHDFGIKVARIVMELSEDGDPETEIEKRESWLKRKNDYLYNLEHNSQEALFICAADKIHNLRSMIDDYQKIGDDLWERFNAPKEHKLWYYKQVLHILERRLANGIVRELKIVYWQAFNLFGNTHDAA